MPRIMNIVPKDIYFLTEFRLDELKKIRMALERSTIRHDGPEEEEAAGYMRDEFYNFICDAIREVEGEEDGT